MSENKLQTLGAIISAVPVGTGVTLALLGKTIVLAVVSATVSAIVGFYVGKLLTKYHDKINNEDE